MKKSLHLQACLFALLFLLFSFQNVYACDLSSGNVLSYTNNNDGTYTILFQLCSEFEGLEGSPREFTMQVNGGPSIVGFSPATVTTVDGDTYTGTSSGNFLSFSYGGLFEPTNGGVREAGVFCNTYSLVVNGLPTTITYQTNTNLTGIDQPGCGTQQDDVCPTPAPPNLTTPSPLCSSDSNFDLTTIDDNSYPAGTWSGTGVGGTTFNPAVGTQTLTFTPNEDCTAPGTVTITVEDAVMPTLSSFGPFCNTDPPFPLPTVQDGASGTWSGAGVNPAGNSFDPSSFGGSTVNLTFNPTGCFTTASTSVMVNASSTPNVAAIGPVCSNAGSVSLSTSQDGTTGTWTGAGVSPGGDSFDPSTFGGNTINLTYTPNEACNMPATISVMVEDAGMANVSPIGPLCNNEPPFALPLMQSGVSGTWSGAGVSPGGDSFNPANFGGSTIQLTFTPSSSGCISPATINVMVDVAQTPNLQTAMVCDADGPVNLTTLQDGGFPNGTWSGTGVSGNNFDPANGTQTLTFTPSDPCTEPAMTTVTVTSAQTPALQTATACETDGPIDLTSLQDGAFPNGTWSGVGVSSNSFDPANGTQTLTFTPSDPCTNPAMTTITVDPAQMPNLQPGMACDSDGPIDLTSLQDGAFPNGTWSGVGVSGNSFDPANGTQTLTFTPTGTCGSPATTTITVDPAQMPNLQPGMACDSDGPIDLTSLQDGAFPNGTWSGVGVSGNSFDPANGTQTLTFTPAGNCSSPATTTITVDPAQTPNLQPGMACETDGPIDLTSLQDGAFPNGTWSGVGVSGNSFDPAVGSQTLTFTAAGSCVNPAMTTITIDPAQTPNLQPGMACDSDGPIDLTSLQDGAFPSGTWSGVGVSGNSFDPAVGSQTLTFTPIGNCANPAMTTITVDPAQMPNLQPGMACETDGPIDLTSLQDGAFPNGTWSGVGVSGNSFDPTNGTQTLTFTPISNCASPATTTITVDPAQTPNLQPGMACETDGPIDLTSLQDGAFPSGTWSGVGVSGNSFDPAVGSQTLTFTAAGTCVNPAMTTITIDVAQTPNLQTAMACETDGPIDLTALQDGAFPNGTWSGAGVSGNSFDPAVGSQTLTFTAADPCTNPAMTLIDITPLQTPNLNNGTTCESDGLFDLTQLQDPAFSNGTWSGPAVSGTNFDPSGQSGTINFTFTPNVPCSAPAMASVTITNSGTPNLNSANVCDLETAFDLTSIEDSSFPGGTWSGPGVNGNTFDATGLNGTINLDFTPTGSCVQPAMTTITIDASQTPTLSPATVCDADGLVDLTALQDGAFPNGTWSGTGVSGNNFDPTVGSQTLTFTPSDLCASSAMTSINVNSAQTPNLQTTTVCENDGLVDLTQLQDPAFSNGTWSGTGVSGDNFDASVGSQTLTFTPSDVCTNPAMTMIDVTLLQTPNLNSGTTCESDGLFDLTQLQDPAFSNGTWSGTAVSGTNFDPSGQSGVVTLTFTPTDDCSQSSTADINITSSGTPTLQTATICDSDGLFDLTTIEDSNFPGGTWSGTGVSGNNLDPTGLSGMISLDFTPTGSCVQPASTMVEITNASTLNLGTGMTCETDAPFSLIALQDPNFNNGTWSGTGVSGNDLDPTGLSGSIDVLFTPNGNCATPTMTTVDVTAAEMPTLDVFSAICADDAVLNLPNMQDGFVGTWSGNGVANNTFNPTGQNGTVTIDFTPDAGQCAVLNSTTIEVNETPFATLSMTNFTTCSSSAQGSTIDISSLVSDGDMSGTWADTDASGADISDLSMVDFDGATPGSYTFTYTTNSAVAPCTEQSYEIEVVVEDCLCPSTATSPPSDLCNVDGMLDLSSLELTNEAGTWTITDGPSTAPLTGTMFDASGADAGEYEITFTINNAQAGCPDNSVQTLTVTPAAIPSLDAFPVMCVDGASFNLPTSQDGFAGSWSGTGVANNMFNPTEQNGTVSIDFTPDAGQCAVLNSTTIEVNENPFATLSMTNFTTCSSSAQGSTIDISSLVSDGDMSGTWADTDASGANISDLSMVDFDGATPGSYTFTYTTNSAVAPCTEQSYEIEVVVEDCLCPSAATSPPSDLCNVDGMLDLSSLELTNEAGTWTITNGPSTAPLTGTMFDASGADAGEYEITFTINNAQAGCPDNSVQTLTVTPAAIPSLDAFPVMCVDGASFNLPTSQDGFAGSWSGTGVANNMFNPTGQNGTVSIDFTPDAGQCAVLNSTTIEVNENPFATLSMTNFTTCSSSAQGSIIDISSLVSDGDMSGTWADTDASGADISDLSMVNFDGVTPGSYTFTYTTNSAVAPCTEQSYEIEVVVEDCLCPSTATSPPSDLCNVDGMLDLSSLELTNEAGTWAITNGPSTAPLTGTMFDASGADAGEYEITFTINNAQAGCPDNSVQTLTVTAAAVPSLTTGTACNTDAAFDLTTLQDASFSNGTWSGIGVTGTTFDPTGLDGIVDLTFTSSDDCTNPATTTVMVTAAETPNLSDLVTCESNGMVDLTTLQDNGFPNGTWSGTGVTGTNFDPSGLDGVFDLTFTPMDDCTNAAMTTIEVSSTLSPDLTNGSTCENDGLFDLTTLQDLAFPDGTWSGTGVTGTNFDPSGQSGTITLTFMPTADCGEAATADINIVSAGTPTLGMMELCEGDAPFDLTTLEDTNFQGGTWSGEGVTGSTFDPSGLDGEISLNFLPTASCVQMATTSIFVNAIPSAAISGSTTICEGNETNLIFTLNGAGAFDVVYQDDAGQNFTLTGITDGHIEAVSPASATTYTLVSAMDNTNTLCPATLAGSVTVEVATAPTLSNFTDDCDGTNSAYSISFDISGGDAATYSVTGITGTLTGTTFVSDPIPSGTAYSLVIDDANSCSPVIMEGLIDCDCPTITALATVSSNFNGAAISCAGEADGEATVNNPVGGIAPYTYAWSNGQTTATATGLVAATYTVTVTDNTGCTTQTEVELTEPSILITDLISDDAGCFGMNNGSIIFDGTAGGTAPFTYTVNNTNQTSPIFNSLTPGTYNTLAQDANGCQFVEEVVIEQGQELVVDAGLDQIIRSGDSIVLDPSYTTGALVDSFLWKPAEFLDCENCENPIAKPTETTTFALTIIDENGCEATDNVTIAVEKKRRVYIPNAFSPDNDGINDKFTIFSDEQVVTVHSFIVMDRWGDIVHESFNFEPNKTSLGWDGTRENKSMNPAVFVYVAEIEFADGDIEVYKGDVSLVR